ETFVTLALDELEKDGADHGLREDLQQDLGHAAIHDAFAVDQDSVLLHAVDRLLVAGNALERFLVVSVRRPRHELKAVGGEPVRGVIDRIGTDGDVLYAFAPVLLEVFDDLARLVLRLIERYADLAAGRSDGSADQSGDAAVYVEVVDLRE